MAGEYPLALRLAEKLYRWNYRLYRPLYFLYKTISEKNEIAYMRQNIRKGMTVLDIGANIGFYTLLASELAGDSGRVFSFEPEPVNFRRLAGGTKKLTNVTCSQAAVGEKTGRLKLYKSDELNVDHHTFDIGETRQCIEIDSVALDDALPADMAVNFIKIDIQGYDYFALKGLAGTIRRSGRVAMLGELWPYGLERAGSPPTLYLDLLAELGFTVTMEDRYKGINPAEKAGDKYFYATFYAEKMIP